MAFNLDMIKGVYARMQERVKAALKKEGRQLILTENNRSAQLREARPGQVYLLQPVLHAKVCGSLAAL